MPYDIWNRRYTGSKYKLADWIFEIIDTHCVGTSFCDIFAGTGVIAQHALNKMKTVIVNDFLYSNEMIYNAFFLQSNYDKNKISHYVNEFQNLDITKLNENYISINYGNKFFSYNDSLLIGEIREQIANATDLSKKEYAILIASLLYSADKVANTVGHYDAYIKGHPIQDQFKFDIITPYTTDADVRIYREDSNILAKKLYTDIVYIDPPYNSRQYSRFYHVLENITTWKKPKLYGEALKPEPENMSEYCKSKALDAFSALINDLQCKYILVSYNNTYDSKSSSSKNKMTLENIQSVLAKKGIVTCFEKSHQFFNAGKTQFADHKELIFLVEVK
jgi:adenine-specific DNA-methyltransferase